MSKFNTLRKAAFSIWGVQHADLTARVAAMKQIMDRHLKGHIPAKLGFGFETIYKDAIPPKAMASFLKMIEKNETDMIGSQLRTAEPRERAYFLDQIAVAYMVDKCEQYGFPYFQLDSQELTDQMDREVAQRAKEEKKDMVSVGQEGLMVYEEARTQAMLENIKNSLPQDQNSLSVLVTGMGHLPLLKTRIPTALANENINAKAVSISLISDQGMKEMSPGTKYPEYRKMIEGIMEEYVMLRLSVHEDADSQSIIEALRNNPFAWFGKDGKPVDATLEKSVDSVLKFLSQEVAKPEASALKEKEKEENKSL